MLRGASLNQSRKYARPSLQPEPPPETADPRLWKLTHPHLLSHHGRNSSVIARAGSLEASLGSLACGSGRSVALAPGVSRRVPRATQAEARGVRGGE